MTTKLFSRLPILTLTMILGFLLTCSASAQSTTDGDILFIGDSFTTGYGIGQQLSYPSLIQQKINANGWSFRVLNGGVNGDTTAGGANRIDGLLNGRIKVVVIGLGINDIFQGVSTSTMRNNLEIMVSKVKRRYPNAKILLAGLLLPMNAGVGPGDKFKEVYLKVAKSTRTILIPFKLETERRIDNFNQMDGMHPSAEGHEVYAYNVWKVLEPVLRDLR